MTMNDDNNKEFFVTWGDTTPWALIKAPTLEGAMRNYAIWYKVAPGTTLRGIERLGKARKPVGQPEERLIGVYQIQYFVTEFED